MNGAQGGREWLEAGTRCLESGDPEGAIDAAQTGLEEVGPDYAPAGTRDDTSLKLAAAEERIAAGHTADGASILLDVLRIRLALLEEREGEGEVVA